MENSNQLTTEESKVSHIKIQNMTKILQFQPDGHIVFIARGGLANFHFGQLDTIQN